VIGWRAGSSRVVPSWAMASAVLSPVVITGGWLVADAFQPPSYSPLRSTVSGLAGLGGTDRWIMTSALILVGGCYFVTAAGLPSVRATARIVLMVAGLSSVGIALSPEPVAGSTPQHLAWTALGAVAITVWPAFTARRVPSLPLILRARGAAVVTAVFLALLGWLVFETQGGTVLGLAERLVSGIQVTWPLVVALALRRATRPHGGSAEYWPAPDDREIAGAARPRSEQVQALPRAIRAAHGHRSTPSRQPEPVHRPGTHRCRGLEQSSGYSSLDARQSSSRHQRRSARARIIFGASGSEPQ
jgi:hypothetical membrane protein